LAPVLVVTAALVPRSVTVTVAPGMTAPPGSVMRPLMLPLSLWAKAEDEQQEKRDEIEETKLHKTSLRVAWKLWCFGPDQVHGLMHRSGAI
jgi:hypothetical protein